MTPPLKNKGNKRKYCFCYKILINWWILVKFGHKLCFHHIYRKKFKKFKKNYFWQNFYCSSFFLLFALFSIIITNFLNIILQKLFVITCFNKIDRLQKKKLKNIKKYRILYCHYLNSIVSQTMELTFLAIISGKIIQFS